MYLLKMELLWIQSFLNAVREQPLNLEKKKQTQKTPSILSQRWTDLILVVKGQGYCDLSKLIVFPITQEFIHSVLTEFHTTV